MSGVEITGEKCIYRKLKEKLSEKVPLSSQMILQSELIVTRLQFLPPISHFFFIAAAGAHLTQKSKSLLTIEMIVTFLLNLKLLVIENISKHCSIPLLKLLINYLTDIFSLYHVILLY